MTNVIDLKHYLKNRSESHPYEYLKNTLQKAQATYAKPTVDVLNAFSKWLDKDFQKPL